MYSVEQLAEQLCALGLSEDTGIVQVHASLRAVGPVAGGSAGVLAALRSALGPRGTVTAFAATPENSETSRLDAGVTGGLNEAELEAYREAMPVFDPLTSPCSPTMGRLSEEIRTTPGSLRSSHPQTSFTAVGPMSAELLADHPLDCHLGERSPVGRLYKEGAWVLMLGAPLTRCTVFQLADYRTPGARTKSYGCKMRGADGVPAWVRFKALHLDDRHFPQMLETTRAELTEAREGRVGDAACVLLPVVQAVDTTARWLDHHPEVFGA